MSKAVEIVEDYEKMMEEIQLHNEEAERLENEEEDSRIPSTEFNHNDVIDESIDEGEDSTENPTPKNTEKPEK